ncbi:uncharacterized protein DS421_14g474330 [Arachis hypogaea]|nr:uncharacterized protein DS421_14g474330 [Arachis hypogaea]
MVFFIALLASCSACVMCFFSHRVFCSALPCSIFGSCHSEIFVLLRTGVSFTSSSQVFQVLELAGNSFSSTELALSFSPYAFNYVHLFFSTSLFANFVGLLS